MNINKKIYNERVARQVFIIFISNTNNESKNFFLGSTDQLPSPLSTWGLVINRENRDDTNKKS
jgi:hypothetical protein